MTKKTTVKDHKITRGWPPERRRKQAERIRETKPWTKSTGPTSESGKARSAQNGFTHGMNTENGRRIRKALQEHRQMIALLERLSSAALPGLTREGQGKEI